MLDTIRYYETPEGIELQLPLAGPAVRASAWLIDLLIRSAIYGATVWLLSLFGKLGTAIILILLFLLEWLYPVIFEVIRGATPGKKVMGLMVCSDNGAPLSWRSSMLRNLLRVADFLPVLYGVGLATMLMNRDFKRLGDLAAGTVVVYAPQKTHAAPLPEGKSLPLPLPLNLTEQRAIADFAERNNSLSPARAEELANLLTPLTGKSGAAAVQTLWGYARWMRWGGEDLSTEQATTGSPAKKFGAAP